jgi:hypothetical protein
MRHIVFLGPIGDLEITWEPDNDEKMKEFITRKMAEGVRFFIMKVGNFKSELTYADKIRDRKVRVGDSDVEKVLSRSRIDDPELKQMVAEGNVTPLRRETTNYETVSVAKTPEEVIGHPVVATRPLRGG